jgi:hypothetical protein
MHDASQENETAAFAQAQRAKAENPSNAQFIDTEKLTAFPAPTSTSTHYHKRSFTRAATSTTMVTSTTKWYIALKSILPIYIGVHLAFFVITCLSVLFILPGFAKQSAPLYTLWQSWHHWDTGNYLVIALHGYATLNQTAFFPFYPILERCVMLITHNPFTAGLLISNVAGLVLLLVFYRLVEEDFDQEHAYFAALYLSIFPTALFLASAYNESLFLCLSLLSFYQMRHGRWWLAGLFGFLASLTRSAGLLLLVPFCFEYFRQHHFSLRMVRFTLISGLAIPGGITLFSLYCYLRFNDPLAFSHAQAHWGRTLYFPGYSIIKSIRYIAQGGGILGFQPLHNILDLGPDLLVLALIILSFVGPWKLPGRLWAYNLYAASLYLFVQLFPAGGIFPLLSAGRFMLEVFPAYIFLANTDIRKYRTLHMSYLMVSGATLCFLLTQFLLGKWVL